MGDRISAQEAAKILLDGLLDPDYGSDNVVGWNEVDWQKVYHEMTVDHNETMEICGVHDWPTTLTVALRVIAGEDE